MYDFVTRAQLKNTDRKGLYVPVSSNSNTFIHTVRIQSNYIVQFIRHPTRAGNVGNTKDEKEKTIEKQETVSMPKPAKKKIS